MEDITYFLNGRCVFGTGLKVSANQLHAAFVRQFPAAKTPNRDFMLAVNTALSQWTCPARYTVIRSQTGVPARGFTGLSIITDYELTPAAPTVVSVFRAAYIMGVPVDILHSRLGPLVYDPEFGDSMVSLRVLDERTGLAGFTEECTAAAEELTDRLYALPADSPDRAAIETSLMYIRAARLGPARHARATLALADNFALKGTS